MAGPLGSPGVPSKFYEILLGFATHEPEDCTIAFDIHDSSPWLNLFSREGTHSTLDHLCSPCVQFSRLTASVT